MGTQGVADRWRVQEEGEREGGEEEGVVKAVGGVMLFVSLLRFGGEWVGRGWYTLMWFETF